jgi:acetyl esterase
MSYLFWTSLILLLATVGYRALQRALRLDRFKGHFQALYPPSETVTWLQRAGQRPLRALIYKPPNWQATDRRPCVVLFFGGAWRVGSVWQFAPFADRLRAQGAVVILPEYRIKSRDRSTVLEAMEDGFALMDQISQSADCLGVDLARVCVGGGSAGGHLAAWIATGAHPNRPQTPQALKPAALLLLNPAVNFPIDQAAYQGYSQQQKFSTRGLAKLSALDPMPHIEPGHPDTLILHGDHDQLVPVDKVKGYAAALQHQNVTVTLKIYPGRAHAFFNQTVSSDDFESSCATLIDFLAERSLLGSAAVIRPSETF